MIQEQTDNQYETNEALNVHGEWRSLGRFIVSDSIRASIRPLQIWHCIYLELGMQRYRIDRKMKLRRQIEWAENGMLDAALSNNPEGESMATSITEMSEAAGEFEANAKAPQVNKTMEYRFGPFRFIPARRTLHCGDVPQRLGSRAFDILAILVERPSEPVSKRELINRVWPTTVVEDGNLKVHVSALRRALGKFEHGSNYIATISGRGYCFVAPVQVRKIAAERQGRNVQSSPGRSLSSAGSIAATTHGPVKPARRTSAGGELRCR